MANITGRKQWSPVRLLETHELARGGVNGNLNEQAQALADRTQLLMEEKASKQEIMQGVYEFGTYAEFDAAKTSLPTNCTVVIGEENTGTGQWGIGNNRWNGYILTKSAFDPVQLSKMNTESLASVKSKPIPENSDFNNITEEGRHRVVSSSHTANFLNCPGNRAGTLEVFFVNAAPLYIQRYTEYAGDRRIFVRTRIDNGTWTVWKEILTSESSQLNQYATKVQTVLDLSAQAKQLLNLEFYGDEYIDSDFVGDRLYANGTFIGVNDVTDVATSFTAMKARLFNNTTSNIEYRVWIGSKLTAASGRGHYVTTQANVSNPDFSGICKQFPKIDNNKQQEILFDQLITIAANTPFVIAFRATDGTKFSIARFDTVKGNLKSKCFNVNTSSSQWSELTGISIAEAGFIQPAFQLYLKSIVATETIEPQPEPEPSYTPEIVLASKIYALRNLETHIYPEHLLLEDHTIYEHAVSCDKGQQRVRGYVFTPYSSDAIGAYPLTWKLYDKQTAQQLAGKASSLVLSDLNSKAGQVLNVLVIGDSYINAGHITQRLLDIAENDVMKVNLIGMRGNGLNKHEGRGGWAIAHYVGSSAKNYEFTVSGVSVIPAINSTNYSHNGVIYKVQEVHLAGGSGTIICELAGGTPVLGLSGTLTKQNTGDGDASIAFSNITEVAGNPFWNNSTNKLDFANYISRNSFSVPDVVFINLGVNDSFGYATDAEAWNFANVTAKTQLNTLINNIKAAFPNIKVVISTPPTYANQDAFGTSYALRQTSWRAKRNSVLFAKGVIANFDNREAENIFVLQAGLNVDTVSNFPINTAGQNTNSHNTTKIYPQNNGVHPDLSGYKQIGDTMFAILKSI